MDRPRGPQRPHAHKDGGGPAFSSGMAAANHPQRGKGRRGGEGCPSKNRTKGCLQMASAVLCRETVEIVTNETGVVSDAHTASYGLVVPISGGALADGGPFVLEEVIGQRDLTGIIGIGIVTFVDLLVRLFIFGQVDEPLGRGAGRTTHRD